MSMACFMLCLVQGSDIVLKMHKTWVFSVCGALPYFIAAGLKSTKAHIRVTNK